MNLWLVFIFDVTRIKDKNFGFKFFILIEDII